MAINLERLTVPDNFAELFGTPVELRNPCSNEDIRLHPQWRSDALAAIRVSNKYFLVDPDLYLPLSKTGQMFQVELRAAASSKGSEFIWPTKLSIPTAVEAAKVATEGWARVVWDSKERGYRVEQAAEQRPDPAWRTGNFQDLLDLVPDDLTLKNVDNPIVQKLLSEPRKRRRA